MKKLLTLFIALNLFVVLSACGNYTANQTPSITRDEALAIALEKAGVQQADIRDLDIELDYERGATVWEVDFEHGNLEFSYDVNAETGTIRKAQRELDF